MLLGLLGCVPAGCNYKPPTAYEPKLSVSALAAGLPTPNNSYELLLPPQTQGRFPCSLAVAKLALPPPELGRCLGVAEMTPAEQACWTESFRGFALIRDLRFLPPLALKTDGNHIRGLLMAAERAGAPLLIVYTPNRYGPNSAQVLGVLYDVEARRPIATLHAAARYLDEDGHEVALENKLGDRREVDATYQASRRFEELALRCVREQAQADSARATTQPHRWLPLYPYYWEVVPKPSVGTPAPRPSPASQPADEAVRSSRPDARR